MFFQIKTIDAIQGYPRMVPKYSTLYSFTENSQKCVTFGYYIIARFASWGPSVPLGDFRPPGIGGCSLTMEQKRVGHVHNGTSYFQLLHNCSLRELGAFGPPGWLPATWDLWLFSGFAKKYNCMYHRYRNNVKTSSEHKIVTRASQVCP